MAFELASIVLELGRQEGGLGDCWKNKMMRFVVLVLLVWCVVDVVGAQAVCNEQVIPDDAAMSLRLTFRHTNFHQKLPPRPIIQRSIVRCSDQVEVLSVPETAIAYEGVPLAGVVTIIETAEPLTDKAQISQFAVPACSGVFISETEIISSAHW